MRIPAKMVTYRNYTGGGSSFWMPFKKNLERMKFKSTVE